MSMAMVGVRSRRTQGVARPSVREVCLVGAPRAGWKPGDRVTWSGRAYTVAATPPRAGGPDGAGPRYAHLTATADRAD